MSSSTKQSLTLNHEDCEKFRRLDHYLAAKFPNLSRSQIKDIFKNNNLTSPHTTLELKRMPGPGTEIQILLPEEKPQNPKGENIPLDILYEDSDILVISKPCGLVVHPGVGNESGTLVNALLFHDPSIENIGDKQRPGIVHRLDKGTSGVMVIAKTETSYKKLVQMFSQHDLTRKYLAIALGREVPVGGTLKSTLGRDPNHRVKMKANVENGKPSATHYKILSSNQDIHFVECQLETGRTHQIRVHLSQILKAPVLSDSLYANKGDQINRLQNLFPTLSQELKSYSFPLLHAYFLGFNHPITNEYLEFQKDPPEKFQKILELAELSKDLES